MSDSKLIAKINDNNVVVNCYVYVVSDPTLEEIEIIKEYLKTNNLDEVSDNLVDKELFEKMKKYVFELENLIQNESEDTIDCSTTANTAAIGFTYDNSLNAFIPPKPEETYILNTEIFEWHPNPELEYDISNGNGGTNKCKYLVESKAWKPVD